MLCGICELIEKVRHMATPTYGPVHYTPDYDRGCVLRELPTGETLHRYTDEKPSLWRDRFGAVLDPQPSDAT
jgi:hypothetical protein